jgi:hypothetical protein
MLFGYNGLPFSFTWPQWTQSLIFYAGLVLFVEALVHGRVAAAAPPFVLIGAQMASLLALHQRNGGARVPMRWWWSPFALVLLAPWVVAGAMLRLPVVWRGRSYALDRNAALASTR